MTTTRPSFLQRSRRIAGRTLRSSPQPVQSLLRRGVDALEAALTLDETHAEAPAVAEVWRSLPPPLPAGVTLDELTAMFRTWSVNGGAPGHLDAYVDDSLWRFCHTWAMVRDESGWCLELGANPYFTTQLLEDYTDLELTLANYYGQSGDTVETVSFVPVRETTRVERTHRSVLFNVEEDQFPFETGSLGVVLFCEIIEHLLMNPLATLREIHRVLRPGGLLVVTTPNVARIDNVMAMVHGANLYDPYSGFGPYGRHNREYTRHELYRLLEFAGFRVETSHTADGHAYDASRWPRSAAAEPLVHWRRDDLGHYLFVRARATGTPREGLPSFLYRSWPDGAIVDYT
jgi:SAM-dependent methyltransferase